MTREEAIKWLKEHHSIDLNTQDDKAHKMAIKALEQESILDKISAEIEEYNNNTWRPEGSSLGNAGWWACNKCIEIIDKYKAESEVK